MTKNKSLIVVGLYCAVMFLLPFSRLAELPILVLSITGLFALFKQWSLLKNSAQFKILTVVFSAYFAMTLFSATDSYWQQKSLQVAFSSLRFYLSAIALIIYIKPEHKIWIIKILSVVAIFWSIDALIQYFIGVDLLGLKSYAGRLNGIFGEHHVKLGPVLALLLPMVMIGLKQHKTIIRWLSVFIIALTILLSGTRSAWLMMGFILLAYWFHQVKQRRFQLLLKASLAGIVMLLSLWFISADFQQRIERSMNIFNGSEAGLDFALADRLPIWKTAWNMFEQHPINGIGAHAFRKAYPDYAPTDDVWQQQGGVGMHAHHWLLEILAETGLIGLIIFSFALIKLLVFIKNNNRDDYSWAYFMALIAAFLPIASTYSLFASFWSICLWFIGSGLILMCENNVGTFKNA